MNAAFAHLEFEAERDMAKARLEVAIGLCAFASGLPHAQPDAIADGPDFRQMALEKLFEAQQDFEELTCPWLAVDEDERKLAPESVEQYGRLVEQFIQEVGDPKDPAVIAKVDRSVEEDRARRAKHQKQLADSAAFEAQYAQRKQERDAKRAQKSGPRKR